MGVVVADQSKKDHAVVSFRDTIALVRAGDFSRAGFALIAALMALMAAPWPWVAAWLVTLLVWELGARAALEDKLVASLPDEDDARAFQRLAAINGSGAALYGVLPFLAWHGQTALGAVLGTAWIAGVAIHLFVYFSHNRLLLAANTAPTVLAAVAAPLSGGFTLLGVAGAACAVSLLVAASRFIFARNTLLETLSEQTAARRAAETLAASKSQFLAVMSHELRTPLNAVIGYSEILEEDLAAAEAAESRDDARKIGAAARNLLALINDILDMSKLEAGQARLRLEPWDVRALVEEVAGDVAALAAEQHNQVRIAIAPGARHAIIDPVKVRQCLLNLASNACKFTQNGRVDIVAAREHGNLLFEVRDTGVGVAAHEIEGLFDLFTQADSTVSRKAGGTGLGLAITRKLARLMGGDCTCASEVGVGSVFTLRIAAGAEAAALAA